VVSSKVRLLSLEQLAGAWWEPTPTGLANARRRLRQLRTLGLIEPWRVNARPLLNLEAPVASWSPGKPVPDPEAVSYQLQTRWNEGPKSTTVWIASKRTLNQFGASGRRLARPIQATHDLHVSAIYLRMLAWKPELAATWVGEDELPREGGGKHPDAILRDDRGETMLVFEFGGAYPAERVAAVHEHYLNEGETPYQIW
jgi:hypothetical protein